MTRTQILSPMFPQPVQSSRVPTGKRVPRLPKEAGFLVSGRGE